RGIDHVVLERGEVANSWRTERWDSLRLLTPNWMTRLPRHAYQGDDPDGFMTAAEVADMITGYGKAGGAPVVTNTTVTAVRPAAPGFVVDTDQGSWQARAVVLASGACNLPAIPAVAEAVPAGVTSLSLLDYRRPEDLPDGGVLVVGASASGVQIAAELHGSGRPVTVAVGEHVRMPRDYRGRDILWWMDAAGVLDEGYREVLDIVRARSLPSMQLVGTEQRATMDLNALSAAGVQLIGRLGAIRDGAALFSGSLPNVCTLADLKLTRLLDLLDEWADAEQLDPAGRGTRPEATRVPDPPPLDLDLRSGQIKTILWATGYRPDYSWLDFPVLDRKGRIRHDGGVVTEVPGLYLMGMPFLRRRKSSLIDGAAADSAELTAHLEGLLAGSLPSPG
ncbi:MAG TPA: NAD(P)-binding domain-containing protein, partial [Sporichthya sp.]|nr:NAD(P)-binding domain-containing protein [Sporichthya sp.]